MQRVPKKSKNKVTVLLLEVIPDQCWVCHDKPYLYLAKIGDELMLYCPQCRLYNKPSSQIVIDDAMERYDWIWHPTSYFPSSDIPS
jgi:hypothetical protein